ncbi:hypothetical protein [Micromonospora phytophila]|nr:hypothetical protein [Micromonospora phytophila]
MPSTGGEQVGEFADPLGKSIQRRAYEVQVVQVAALVSFRVGL